MSDEMRNFMRNFRAKVQRMKDLNLTPTLSNADWLEYSRILKNDYEKKRPEAVERTKEKQKEKKEEEDRMKIDSFLNAFEETKKSLKAGRTYRLPSFTQWVDTGRIDLDEWVGFWNIYDEDEESLNNLTKWAKRLQENYKQIDRSASHALTRGGTNYRGDE
jgi:CRISPR/Cas system CSM-associated protein Csm4 (group 5 of RAMP superfamily)